LLVSDPAPASKGKEGYVIYTKEKKVRLVSSSPATDKWKLAVVSNKQDVLPPSAGEHEWPEASMQARAAAASIAKGVMKNALLGEHLLVLSGAGTSIGIGQAGKLGLSMHELWDKAEAEVEDFTKIAQGAKFDDGKKNLEGLLSTLHFFAQVESQTGSNPIPGVDLAKGARQIKGLLVSHCTLELPDNAQGTHVQFLHRITNRKTSLPRAKVFTLNYDTLFEQAARKLETVTIDGFSFTQPRIFGGQYYNLDIVYREHSRVHNEENFLRNAFHLYKLHGSVDWKKIDDARICQHQEAGTDDPVMIFPTNSKIRGILQASIF
jgi:hypothetical protein